MYVAPSCCALANFLTDLHPAHKGKYFRHMRWPMRWITMALDLTRETWLGDYARPDLRMDIDRDEGEVRPTHMLCGQLHSHLGAGEPLRQPAVSRGNA
jgi:hypothetical protein